MPRLLLTAFVVCASLWGTTVHATSFAVLLGTQPNPTDPKCEFVNPLYQQTGSGGTNVLFEPRSLSFRLSEIWNASTSHSHPVEFKMDTDLPSHLPPLPPNAFAFSLTLLDSNNVPIHNLDAPISVFADLDAGLNDRFVFGYLDEGVDPPKWQAQEECLRQSDGFLCGTTDHLSYFYIVPMPEPSTFALVGAGICGLAVHFGWRRHRPGSVGNGSGDRDDCNL